MSDENVTYLFPKKALQGEQTLLEFWKSRNQIISDGFVTMSVWEKQNILDTIIQVNNDLYELALKLKGEI